MAVLDKDYVNSNLKTSKQKALGNKKGSIKELVTVLQNDTVMSCMSSASCAMAEDGFQRAIQGCSS